MAPAKVDDDPVTAEYDVFLTPALEEHIYLLQYPNRPRNRPYSDASGAMPDGMRIKPNSGFMEVDVVLNTRHNFNKYMGLKWGDASRVSHELHNASGTYGPASGLTMAKPRSMNRSGHLKDKADRELDYDNDLRAFQEAEKDNKVHTKQVLGGLILRHDAESEIGKPYYFVGAFQGDQLHLTKVTGTVQLRPQFHHLDAEEERARIAISRAQQEASGPGPEPTAHAVRQRIVEHEDKATVEFKMKTALQAAQTEQWIKVDYTDDEDPIAYEVFNQKLKIRDVSNVPHLKSEMDNDEFLDAISAPRHDSPTRRRKRAPRRKDPIDMDDEEGEPGVEAAG